MASVPPPGPNGRNAPPAHRPHVVGPLILLGAGVLLLLNNFQILPWSVWRDLWPYWPVLLVLLGIEAFVTGRVAWGTLVLLVFLLPVVGLTVAVGDLAFRWRDATRATAVPGAALARQPLDGATSASVEIEYGAGALEIGPLPPELASDMLAEGDVFGHGSVRFEAQSTLRNGRRVLQIGPRDIGNAFDLGRLVLRLTPAVPIDLKIEAGAAELTLNLERLRIANLAVETGASRTMLVLPAQGETNVQIEGGAAGVDIAVPPNVAARIIVDGGPNRIQIDEQRFPRQRGEYRSASFETATDRVTLRIDVGASRVVVQ